MDNAAASPNANFYPRPPRGGRRVYVELGTGIFADFYPRPPRGGRPCPRQGRQDCWIISIHALREEGDLAALGYKMPDIPISIHALREEGDLVPQNQPCPVPYFYPRPPRGGRRTRAASRAFARIFLSTPSARRATSFPTMPKRFRGFLSTPSARRATSSSLKRRI